MTPEQQRIKLAEWDGWERDERCDCWRNTSEGIHAVAFLNRSHMHRQLPDYLSDLNAVHKLEKKLNDEEWIEYDLRLREIVRRGCPVGNGLHSKQMIHATAAQRCEALLKTLGLWEESE